MTVDVESLKPVADPVLYGAAVEYCMNLGDKSCPPWWVKPKPRSCREAVPGHRWPPGRCWVPFPR